MLSRHPLDRCESSADERALLERDRASWQQHLWSCRACRSEALARRGLERAAQAAVVPRLSAEFDAHLFARLHREEAPRRLPSGARRWLALYWIVTGALSIVIAARTEVLTLERGLDMLTAVVLAWGLWQMIPPRLARRAAALFGG